MTLKTTTYVTNYNLLLVELHLFSHLTSFTIYCTILSTIILMTCLCIVKEQYEIDCFYYQTSQKRIKLNNKFQTHYKTTIMNKSKMIIITLKRQSKKSKEKQLL